MIGTGRGVKNVIPEIPVIQSALVRWDDLAFDSGDEPGILAWRNNKRTQIRAGGRAHIMGDMQQTVAADDRPYGGGQGDVGPGRRVEEYLAFPPTHRDMRIGALGIVHIAGWKIRSPVLLRCDERHDDCGMNTVGFDHDFDTAIGFGPARIPRNGAADPCSHKKQHEQADEHGQCPRADTRSALHRWRLLRSHKIDQSPFTNRRPRRNPSLR